ncbi:hypothetical protein [Thaumasiovibrio subtropicus]|uniref:hypothetical protein n=1 Tax=Thaumasiovibrio subtropicus TaxID=1891207 RepID=UPI000B3603A6|nr:hypothetical protein [Thaumasiovibrio subtropicus]
MVIVTAYFDKEASRKVFFALTSSDLKLNLRYFNANQRNRKRQRPSGNFDLDYYMGEGDGFYLYSEVASIYFCYKDGFYKLRADFSLKVPSNTYSLLFKKISRISGVSFAFCCDRDELVHRNRVSNQTDSQVRTKWIGLDPNKLIPGIYWKTYISNQLLSVHKVHCRHLSLIPSFDTKENENGILISAFPIFSDWKRFQKLIDEVLYRNQGFFSKIRFNEMC